MFFIAGQALAHALKENRSVQVLNVGNNAIGDEGAQVPRWDGEHESDVNS